jgi:uncharacterized protein YqgC (DUF456 family)
MTAIEWTALATTTLIMVVGLVCSLLPIVPGNLIVWLGIIVHRLWLGAEASVSWQFILITGGLTLLGQLADFFLGYWGARRFGASWKGAMGAVGGAFIGFFLPPPLFWLIVGPILGAIAGELAAGSTLRQGGSAGLGSVLGGILAFALKFALSICLAALFYAELFLFGS